MKSHEPMYPILNDDQLRAIPWALLLPHEKQAQSNHSQSLQRLASRGGLSPCEALAIIEDRPWTKVAVEYARAKLMRIIWDAKRAEMIAARKEPDRE